MKRSKSKDVLFASDHDLFKTHTVVLDGPDPEARRLEILEYFHKTFSLYESLFECLNGDEAFYASANPLRHPLIFYYGHTAVFFINKLNVAGLIKERIDLGLESMFAVGVDEMSWDDLNEKHYDWPAPAEIKSYRDKARAVVDRFIRACPVTLPVGWDDPLWIVMMGIEHERIHLETSAVLLRELPLKHVRQHPLWGNICRQSGAAPENELLPVAGGTVTLGKDRSNPLYGWDNEYGRETVQVEPFRASKYIVSNREFLAFVKDGGYMVRQHWTAEGWAWVTFKNAIHPAYWVEDGGGFKYRTMLEVIDMPWDWPVEINYLEAKAFCNWRSVKTSRHIRMPTEAEWSLLRKLADTDEPYWDRAPGNINLEHYMSACPVNQFAFLGGFYDIIGNVWQWTETPMDAFEGFEVHPAYDDFSTPTFDGKHNIFKGGCWISTGNVAIKDARYAFRRHFFQNAGLRYVEGEELKMTEPNIYETDKIVSQYIEFHYGDEYFGVPNFPAACAKLCLEYIKGRKTEKVLDVGCAAGRASFELAKTFSHVDALDFSARLIQAPTNLQKTGTQRYVVQDEGELITYKEARLDRLGLDKVADKISFVQGDACNLAAKFTGYDLVFAGNLLDRLYDPAKFLGMIHERINPGGLLILTSPYTWLEEFTERAKWLGGFKASTGENYTTMDGLKNILATHFRLLDTKDIPFIIRETRRKFQHTISEVTVWERK
ncbi:MAG: 5-histidylcysteine sulfoxide synthase [Alphaproteobacteria bacterium]|nr:5-histidylcysteine sulfoxide synthase [Alphaproteobacteria bacterium]